MKKNILLLSLLFIASFGQKLLATSDDVLYSCDIFTPHDFDCSCDDCMTFDLASLLSLPQSPVTRPKRKNSEISNTASTNPSAHPDLPTKKRQRKKCIHGKRKTYCKECGGSAFCTHGNWKSICKECGGSALCTHGKRKSYCKECGGSAFCTHGKRKNRCKTCKVPCPHAEKRYQCKEGCYESLAQRREREAAIARSVAL